MRALITGFDPFGGEAINPAWEAVARLPGLAGSLELTTLQVPTSFKACSEAVKDFLLAERPDAVLCVGQAGGRSELSLERVAINLVDARIPDNSGDQPIDAPVVPGAPAAYFSTLPVKTMAAAIRRAGLPGGLSYSAGSFVCNALMFEVLHFASVQSLPLVAGFIHVPFLPIQAAGKTPPPPSMSLEGIRTGLMAALEALSEWLESGAGDDLAFEGGTLD